MADYRDLLRRAVEALPQNNGAARRQVYDKARKALYSQLRAIEPPLPSREITQHRLQLEDCIREVEQHATEQLLGNFQDDQSFQDVSDFGDDQGSQVDDQDSQVDDQGSQVGDQEIQVDDQESPLRESPLDDQGSQVGQNHLEEQDVLTDHGQTDLGNDGSGQNEAVGAPETPASQEVGHEADPVPEPDQEEGHQPTASGEKAFSANEAPVAPLSEPEPPAEAEPEQGGGETAGPNAHEDPDTMAVPPGAEFGSTENADQKADAGLIGPFDADPAKATDFGDQESGSVEDGGQTRSHGMTEPAIGLEAHELSIKAEPIHPSGPYNPQGAATSIDEIILQAQMAEAEMAVDAATVDGDETKLKFDEPSASGKGPRAERVEPVLPAGAATATSVKAMSSVREVEVEGGEETGGKNDPQYVIDQAIAALDLEAHGPNREGSALAPAGVLVAGDVAATKGDTAPAGTLAEKTEPKVAQDYERLDESAPNKTGPIDKTEGPAYSSASLAAEDAAPMFAGTASEAASIDAAESAGGTGNALTIFLIVFVLLLVGVGGAGYWAWREGYVDLGTLLGGNAQVAVDQNAGQGIAPTPQESTQREVGSANPDNRLADAGSTPAMSDGAAPVPSASAASSGAPSAPSGQTVVNGNTTSQPDSNAGPSTQVADSAAAAAPSTGDVKMEDRLPSDTAAANPDTNTSTAAAGDAAASGGGNQALLLEASDSGQSGAVPYSGMVDWSRGSDEMGQPTLEAKASIPARNLKVNVLIRKNSDATLPASHLMEIDFDISDSFIGGGIGRVVGVLMKDKELVQGKPLVGASARVVGNSFLFALTADAKDVAANEKLLQTSKWMDLALIYSTGKRAIITLEKDAATQQLFDQVMTAWGTAAPAAAQASPASGG